MASSFPYQFPQLPGLTGETQLYTQRRSNGENPTEYRFTVNDLLVFLASNYDLVAIEGSYASDAAAATGGVAVGGCYELSAGNIYGLPAGTLKRRTA